MMHDNGQVLNVPQGQFELGRLPKRPKELLRAFDAADEYLLAHLAASAPAQTARLLVLNDSFGALAVALAAWRPCALSDSYLSQQATRLNLAANGLAETQVALISSLAPLTGHFDWVLIKVPKTLALLEDQLLRLRPHLSETSQVVVAGMVKALPANVWKLLERCWGRPRLL